MTKPRSHRLSLKLVLGAALFSLGAFAAPVLAQSALGALKACTWIKEETARLKCFDQAMQEIEAGGLQTFNGPAGQSVTAGPSAEAVPSSTGVVSSTRAGRSSNARAGFGLPAARQVEQLDEITVVITRFRIDRQGKHIFTTQDGQIWRQTDSRTLPLNQDSFSVVIKKGMFGAHFMTIPDIKRSIKVKRQK